MSGLLDVGFALNFLFVAAISVASYHHFDRRESEPVGATLLSFATLVGAALNTLVWSHVTSRDPPGETIAIAMAVAAGLLFVFAITESRGGGLWLAFSSRTPPNIIQRGIYAHIRHPFYLSYMLFWWDWWPLNAFHPVSLALAALMTAIYVIAARKEELLLAYRFGARYIDYTRRTKQFVPWVF